MAFEDYQTKDSVVVVYTGEGKGKTSASIGLLARALGAGWTVAYIQFIKAWEVNEHKFIDAIMPLYNDKLLFYKGGKGFYNAGDISAKAVSEVEHQKAALQTYQTALQTAQSGDYQLVICDEINNAYNDGLLSVDQIEQLITSKHPKTSLCLTGRNFPEQLLDKIDIATHMTKMKHHYDDKFLANEGIDY
ncbi:cob(I)yrinic acid a,c-diamide adenosyltransferase [Candidatus Saccharibacteria bacterium]|nr:cob(I)yrinic acid a,c-diamide adenosyltransferase [Candidatus Saccharibacteria bacterium]